MADPFSVAHVSLLVARNRRLETALQALIDVMDRCEPDVDPNRRASDDEWIKALAAAKRVLPGSPT